MELYKKENWLRYQYEELEKFQSEIAEECGVTQKTISKWMRKLGIATRGPRGPRWKGKRMIDAYKGYWWVYRPDHPYCRPNGYVKQANIIMEKKLGRYLRPEEVVHHRDLNKLNDNMSNLQIMTFSEHSSLHAKIHKFLRNI